LVAIALKKSSRFAATKRQTSGVTPASPMPFRRRAHALPAGR
jgi:hypothetical protein